MFAVIFEVQISEGKNAEYLEVASEIKSHLTEIDGFISIERFQSLSEENKILSLSFWRDESAIKAWRNLESHRAAQSKGINDIFKNYRLRVAGIIRDYGSEHREEAPQDSVLAHED